MKHHRRHKEKLNLTDMRLTLKDPGGKVLDFRVNDEKGLSEKLGIVCKKFGIVPIAPKITAGGFGNYGRTNRRKRKLSDSTKDRL